MNLAILIEILRAYQFKTTEQQLDIIRLLFLAGCFEPKQLEEDLRSTGHDENTIKHTLETVKRATNPVFNPAIILAEAFPVKTELHLPITLSSNILLEKAHNWLIKITQRAFFARAAGQERWQVQAAKWLTPTLSSGEADKQAEAEIVSIINRLKLGFEVAPQKTEYDAIVVFGGAVPRMQSRMAYAKKLIEENNLKASQIYLLCGERPADKAVDTEKAINEAAEFKLNSEKEITEKHLMMLVHKNVKGIGAFSKIPHQVVASPMIVNSDGSVSRPTTIDTLIKLSKDLDDKVKSLLFISGAPDIQSQAVVTRDTLIKTLQGKGVHHEVAGHSLTVATPLNRFIMPLGGYLFADYVRVAQVLGSQKNVSELESIKKTLSFQVKPNAPTATAATITTTAATAVVSSNTAVTPKTDKPVVATPVTPMFVTATTTATAAAQNSGNASVSACAEPDKLTNK